MDSLIDNAPDIINVFDRGYVDYAKFDEYCREKIRFVSRLKENAFVDVINDGIVEEDSPIEKDLLVILGKGRTRMKHELRLVVTQDSKGNPITIVTNDFKMSAEEISDIYRYRKIGVSS